METFPRKGTELSTECELLFGKAKHKRPAILIEFEDGSREGRFRTPSAAYDFEVVFTGHDDDFTVMMAFLDTHGAVTPFTLIHPDYGTGTANFVLEEHEIEKVVGGNPRWRRIVMPIRSQF
jgi:hypothetical protein